MSELTERVSQPSFVADRGGRILHVNAAFEALTGYARGEAVGATTRLLLRSGAQPPEFYRDLWGTILAGRVWAGSVVNRRRDGSLFRAEEVITPIHDAAGEVSSFLATLSGLPDPPHRGLAQTGAFEPFLTRSPRMTAIFDYLERMAPANECLVITGPSGVGKELLARAVHELSDRRRELFLGVNAAAIPATLFASHLFGHVAGAFSGATSSHGGYLRATAQGTLFLDEIGDLSLELQTQLLRVLQEREYFVLGQSRPVPLTSRLVVASNLRLEDEVAAGRFRADLFHRLRAGRVEVPPLAERREDVPLLVEHFARRYARAYARPVSGVSPLVLEVLQGQPWPGNVRELQNVVREAVLLEDGKLLSVESLPTEYRRPRRPTPEGLSTLAELEREHILRALEACQGQVSWTAEVLGISRMTLSRRLKAYGRGAEP
ncbi:MAG: sigma 54-interacting transcriptional regulator [Planctomycetota bacterium]